MEINSTIRIDQISFNTLKKIPVRSTNTVSLDNNIITETLASSIRTEILFNSINPDPSKYPGHLKYNTFKKNVLDVHSTTKV